MSIFINWKSSILPVVLQTERKMIISLICLLLTWLANNLAFSCCSTWWSLIRPYSWSRNANNQIVINQLKVILGQKSRKMLLSNPLYPIFYQFVYVNLLEPGTWEYFNRAGGPALGQNHWFTLFHTAPNNYPPPKEPNMDSSHSQDSTWAAGKSASWQAWDSPVKAIIPQKRIWKINMYQRWEIRL